MSLRRIATIQAGLREAGRIRLGSQESYERNGVTKFRPVKFTTFRLTSRSRESIDSAAAVYGGKVTRWEDAPTGMGEQWQVTIDSPFLEVIVPPNGYESSFELWSAGGCQRRCDGLREDLSGGPCLCPADPHERTALAKDGRACKPTSRLSVLLPTLKGLGRWPLVSHSYYAAVELGAVADFLGDAGMKGYEVWARLRIEERSVKRPGTDRDGKPSVETHHFIVPVLEIPDLTPQQMLSAGKPVRQIGPGVVTVPNLPHPVVVMQDGPDTEPLEGEIVEDDMMPGDPAERSGMSLEEIQSIAKEQNVSVSMLNAQAKLLEPTGRTLPVISPQERLELAQRLLGV
jgi:hypothetical protein